ncbi:PucR family transcriptional regulator [Streptomyces viridiviolaceus]
MEGHGDREAIQCVLARVEERLSVVGARLIDSYLSEIVDYRALGEQTLRADVLPIAQRNVQELLIALCEDSAPLESSLEAFRRSAARRVHQGIPLQALLHAYRLWGQVVWQEIVAATDPSRPQEREAALAIAGRVMAYVDQVSIAVAQSYVDEVTGVLGDREAMRRDLLEALISGRAISERVRRRAAASALDVDGQHAVVLARALEPLGNDRSALRAALVGARGQLRPASASILVGIREDEVVAIYPVTGRSDYSTLVEQAGAWALELSGFAVGVGRAHDATDGIAASYAEAEEAVRLGAADGGARVSTFSEVLLDHLLSNSPHLRTLQNETVAPLHAYDHSKNAQLVRTLRVYYEHGFNLARSAAQLRVHPNTVVYRLRRIHQLTGHDPSDPDQLLLLLLGMKSDRWTS